MKLLPVRPLPVKLFPVVAVDSDPGKELVRELVAAEPELSTDVRPDYTEEPIAPSAEERAPDAAFVAEVRVL